MRPITAPTNANATVGRGKRINQNHRTSIFLYLDKSIKGIQNRVWVTTYTMEEARQHYANTRHLLKQAAACIAIYFLRMVA